MKLLIVSHLFTPDVNARALRWGRIAREWRAAGHDVVVVTRRQPGLPARETLDGLDIHRVGGSLVEGLRRSVATPKDGQAEDRVPAVRRAVAGFVRALYAATWRRVYWPDQAGPWILPARRAASALLERGGFDALVSVSHPFSGHVVGLALKRRFPTLPWLADSGDPFSFFEEIPLNNAALYGRLNRRVEAAVLARADVAAVTVESCRAAYAEAFPESVHKLTVIAPLVTVVVPAVEAAPVSDPFRLVYIGTLYKRIRNPAFLLRLLAALPQATLDFYGDPNDCADQFEALPPSVSARVRRHGVVSGTNAARALVEAGTLVNIGNSTRHQLPSKIFEYVAAGRPILNLIDGNWDSTLPLLAEYPPVYNLITSNSGPSAAEIDSVVTWLGTVAPADPDTVERLLAPHRPAAIAEAYLQSISRLSSSLARGQ